jgi:hypothetical protein
MENLDAFGPWVGGLGGGVGVLFLVWRVIIWADTRTRADNAELRAEMAAMKVAHNNEINNLQSQINQFRQSQRASEDLAAEYKRQLIVAGLFTQPVVPNG